MSLRGAARTAWTKPYYLRWSPTRLMIRLFEPRGENIIWNLLIRESCRRGIGFNDGLLLLGCAVAFAASMLPTFHLPMAAAVGIAFVLLRPALSFRTRVRRTAWLQGLLASPLGGEAYASAFARLCGLATAFAAIPYLAYAAPASLLGSETRFGSWWVSDGGRPDLILLHTGLLSYLWLLYAWWIVRRVGLLFLLMPVWHFVAGLFLGDERVWFLAGFGATADHPVTIGNLWWLHDWIANMLWSLWDYPGCAANEELLDYLAIALTLSGVVLLYLVCRRYYPRLLCEWLDR